MEKMIFSVDNCQVITDDSCCLQKEELKTLGVIAIPYDADLDIAKYILKTSLKEKEFVLFVGTAQSISNINEIIKQAAEILDEKDKSLDAQRRVLILNTSSFSGGLGYFVTLFTDFLKSGEKDIDDIEGYALFLANHIAHFFIEPSQKRWNNVIYVPRTGNIRRSGEKLRGNKGVYNYIVGNFRDFAYHQQESVWICCHDKGKAEAKDLARQFKRGCPEVSIDFSHKLKPNIYNDFSDSIIACFFLSMDVRPDKPSGDMEYGHFDEIEEKRRIAKKNITAISRYGLAFSKNPNPDF